MTELLEKAFTEVSKLPEQEQGSFAAWILEEISSEQRWEENFAKSRDLLEKLAEEALKDHHAGITFSGEYFDKRRSANSI